MDKKDVWSTADIIKNRNNWTLASDAELLKHLKSLSEKLYAKSRSTLNLLNLFENEVNSTCISVANVNNRFRALSDTQFIESKVEDDTSQVEEPSAAPAKPDEKPSGDDITAKLKEALDNGIQVLRTQYDIIAVTDSDSDDDESQEVLLRARNPYMLRRLPYVIGSEDFTKYDHLGLVTSSEDEEDDESESEEDEDDIRYMKTEASKPLPVEVDLNKPRTEVIRISSDSEDSAESLPHDEEFNSKAVPVNPEPSENCTSNTFADHLNETLKNITNSSVSIPPYVEDIFSPPPFPTKNTIDLSDDERSDSSSSDIFSSKKFSKPQPSDHNFVQQSNSSTDEEKLGNKSYTRPGHRNSPQNNESSRKSSTISDVSPADSSKPFQTMDNHLPQLPAKPKPQSKVHDKELFNAIHAELNAKLKKNIPAKDELGCSDENNSSISKSSVSTSSSHKNSAPSPKSKKAASTNNSVVKPASRSNLVTSPKASVESHQEDSFVSKTTRQGKSDSTIISSSIGKSPVTPKVVAANLFEEDDSMDDLFNSSTNSNNSHSSPSKQTQKPANRKLFDDNAADNVFAVPNKKEENLTMNLPTTAHNAPNVTAKLDLFNDDSDSDDDIFSIINSQKKKAPQTEVRASPGPKPALASADEDLFGSVVNKKNIPNLKNDLLESDEDELPKPQIKNSPKKESFRSSNEDISKVLKATPQLIDAKPVGTKNLFGSESMSEAMTNSNILSSSQNTDLFAPDDDEGSESAFVQDVNFESHETVISLPKEVNSPKLDISRKAQLGGMFMTNNKTNTRNSSPTVESVQTKPESKKAQSNDMFNTSNKTNTHNSSPTVESVQTKPEPPAKKKYAIMDDLDPVDAIPKSNITSSPVTAVADKIDGSTASKNISREPPPIVPRTPGKLSANRGLNINVNALLPGSSWSATSKQAKNTGQVSSSEPQVFEETPKSKLEKEADSLNNIIKTRAKVSTRRRPPSRRARVNKAAESNVFAATTKTTNSSDEETDNVYKTASESNSPDYTNFVSSNKSVTGESKSEVKGEESEHKEDRDQPSNNILKRDNVLNIIDNLDSIPYTPSSSTLPSFTKERARRPKPRPPSALQNKNVTDSDSASSVENTLHEKKQNEENETACHLGSNLVTASASREPPAMQDVDLKSLLEDSDDNVDDIFSDVFHSDKDDHEDKFEKPTNLATSSSHDSESKTLASNESRLFTPLENKKTVAESFLKSPCTKPNKPASNLFVSDDDDTSEVMKIKSEINVVAKTPESIQPIKSVSNLFSDDALNGSDSKDLAEEITKANVFKSSTAVDSGPTKNPTESNIASTLFDSLDADSDDDDFNNLFSKSIVSLKPAIEKSKPSTPQQNQIPKNSPSTEAEKYTPGTINKNAVNKSSSKIPEVAVTKNTNPSPLADPPAIVKTRTVNLFAGDDGDDIFSNKLVIEPRATEDSSKSVVSTEAKDDQLLNTNKSKPAADIFSDDNELFAASKKRSTKSKPIAKSLFDDDDGDDLFGSKVSSRGTKSSESLKKESQGHSAEKANIPEKGRVVKLRSEAVGKDPLTGKPIQE